MRLRFRYSKVLDDLFHQLQQKGNYPDTEFTLKKMEEYKSVWGKYEEFVIEALQQNLGLIFFHDTLDVYVVESLPYCISTPVIIHANINHERFIYILAHELTHVLLSDNKDNFSATEKLSILYPNESRKTRNHIAVNAVMEQLFREAIKEPKHIEIDKKVSKGKLHYERAWQIVEQEGYKNILFKLFNK